MMHAAAVECIKLRVTWWQWHNARVDLLVSGVTFECGVRNNPTVGSVSVLRLCSAMHASHSVHPARILAWVHELRLPCNGGHYMLVCSQSRRPHTKQSRRQRLQQLVRQSWMRSTASCGTDSPQAMQVADAEMNQGLCASHAATDMRHEETFDRIHVLMSCMLHRSKAVPLAGAPCCVPAHQPAHRGPAACQRSIRAGCADRQPGARSAIRTKRRTARRLSCRRRKAARQGSRPAAGWHQQPDSSSRRRQVRGRRVAGGLLRPAVAAQRDGGQRHAAELRRAGHRVPDQRRRPRGRPPACRWQRRWAPQLVVNRARPGFAVACMTGPRCASFCFLLTIVLLVLRRGVANGAAVEREHSHRLAHRLTHAGPAQPCRPHPCAAGKSSRNMLQALRRESQATHYQQLCAVFEGICSAPVVTPDTTPRHPLQVKVDAAALLLRCDAHAAQTLLSLAAGCANYLQFYSYRRARPQVPTAAPCSGAAATQYRRT